MKKFYEAPELEMIQFTLRDVILNSKEDDINELIDDGNNDGGIGDELLDP